MDLIVVREKMVMSEGPDLDDDVARSPAIAKDDLSAGGDAKTYQAGVSSARAVCGCCPAEAGVQLESAPFASLC